MGKFSFFFSFPFLCILKHNLKEKDKQNVRNIYKGAVQQRGQGVRTEMNGHCPRDGGRWSDDVVDWLPFTAMELTSERNRKAAALWLSVAHGYLLAEKLWE